MNQNLEKFPHWDSNKENIRCCIFNTCSDVQLCEFHIVPFFRKHEYANLEYNYVYTYISTSLF